MVDFPNNSSPHRVDPQSSPYAGAAFEQGREGVAASDSNACPNGYPPVGSNGFPNPNLSGDLPRDSRSDPSISPQRMPKEGLRQSPPPPYRNRKGRPARRLRKGRLMIVLALVILLLLGLVLAVWLNQAGTDEVTSPLLTPLPRLDWVENGHTGPYQPPASKGTNLPRVWPLDSVGSGAESVPLPQRAGWEEFRKLEQEGATERPLLGLTVYLDPGHGGQDPGTVWAPAGKYLEVEKEAALTLSNGIAKHLRQLGATVHQLRKEDVFVSIYARTAWVGEQLVRQYLSEFPDLAKRAGLDRDRMLQLQHRIEALIPPLQEIQEVNRDDFGGILGGIGASEQAQLLYEIERQYPTHIFLSVHLNAAQREEAGGTQVYLLRSPFLYAAQNVSDVEWASAPYRFSSQGAQGLGFPLYIHYDDTSRALLALSLYEEIDRQIPVLRTRAGLRSVIDQNFAVLRTCNLSGVLLETGFLTNSQDRAYLFSEQAPQAFGKAISQALRNYVQKTANYHRQDP